MPAGRPWYQRNPSDFIVGTIGWDLELRGAYSLLIDMLNERDRPIPDDARFVAGCLNVTTRKWGQLRQRLIDTGKIIVLDDGCLSNPRFERERAQRHNEHEQAVENGRRGGRISAAKRAAEQGDLGLENPAGTDDAPRAHAPESEIISAENGAKTPEKRREKIETVEISPEINSQERQISAVSDQPPPQASRARDRSEIRDKNIQPNESYNAAKAVDRLQPPENGQGPDPLDQRDLKALMDACSEASGYWPTQPGHIAKAFDVIKGWRDLGVDFDAIVIPTIRNVIANSTDPTGSFQRFDKRIRHEHARKAAQPKGSAYVAPQTPIVEVEGEPEVMTAIRRAMLERLGPVAYCHVMNPIRLEPVEDAGGERKPIKVIDPRPTTMKLENGPHHSMLLAIAKHHGFTGLW